MQRAEDQVAGERRLDRHLGHFQIADFADEDDVGRLAQHRAEDLGEREPDCLAHLALIDADEIVFHRIFGGDDLAIGAIELVERAVERRRFARAGGPRHQEDAVGALDDLLELLVVFVFEPEIGDADAHRIGSQNTQHDRLAVIRRQRADAEVDLALIDRQLDAAVLRQALFGDVDAGHDLQSAGERAFHADGDFVALDALAVDAIAHANAVLHRLDVNVAGAVSHGLGDHRLHQLDDRRLRGVVHDVFAHAGDVDRFVDRAVERFVHGLVERLVHRRPALIQRLVDCVLSGAAEEVIQITFDAALGGEHGAEFFGEAEAENVEELEIERIVDGDAQLSLLHAQRQNEVLAHDVIGNQVDGVGRDRALIEIDVFHPMLSRQRLGDLVFVAEL